MGELIDEAVESVLKKMANVLEIPEENNKGKDKFKKLEIDINVSSFQVRRITLDNKLEDITIKNNMYHNNYENIWERYC